MKNQSTSIEGTLTIADLATLLRVTRRSIDNYRRQGVIPAPDFSIGKCPRWRVSTVERALAALRPANSDQ